MAARTPIVTPTISPVDRALLLVPGGDAAGGGGGGMVML